MFWDHYVCCFYINLRMLDVFIERVLLRYSKNLWLIDISAKRTNVVRFKHWDSKFSFWFIYRVNWFKLTISIWSYWPFLIICCKGSNKIDFVRFWLILRAESFLFWNFLCNFFQLMRYFVFGNNCDCSFRKRSFSFG